MSEIKMLSIAFTSMVAMAALSAAILLGLKTSDATLLCVTTVVSVASYLAVCLYCLPRVAKRKFDSAAEEK